MCSAGAMEWVNHFPFPWSQTKSNSAAIVIVVVAPGGCSEQLSSELSCYFKGEGGLTDRQTDRQPFPFQGKMRKSRHRLTLVQAGKPGCSSPGGVGVVGSEQGDGRQSTLGAGPRTALQDWTRPGPRTMTMWCRGKPAGSSLM